MPSLCQAVRGSLVYRPPPPLILKFILQLAPRAQSSQHQPFAVLTAQLSKAINWCLSSTQRLPLRAADPTPCTSVMSGSFCSPSQRCSSLCSTRAASPSRKHGARPRGALASLAGPPSPTCSTHAADVLFTLENECICAWRDSSTPALPPIRYHHHEADDDLEVLRPYNADLPAPVVVRTSCA